MRFIGTSKIAFSAIAIFALTSIAVDSAKTDAAILANGPAVIHSARSGPWSDRGTWEGGQVPGAGRG